MNGDKDSGVNNGDIESYNNRKRIRIACDTCRRKKIKCNGENPCSNCIPSKSECFYKERKAKKRSLNENLNKKLNNAKSFESLDSRLSRLENIVSKLSSSIEVIANGIVTENKSTVDTNDTNFDSDGNEVDGEDDETDDTDDNEPMQLNHRYETNESRINDSNSYIVATTPIAQKTNTKVKAVEYSFPSEHYYGIHSIMCIFSNQSLDWIENILGSEAETLVPVRNVPLLFKTKLKTFVLKFMDPPMVDLKDKKRLLEKPFPEDQDLLFALLNTFYSRMTNINLLVPIDELKKMFEEYYANFDISKSNPNRKRRKFRQSELLIMTIVLLFSISTKIDQDIIQSNTNTPNCSAKVDTPQSLQDFPDSSLLALKETLFENAIFYYHRICVISDGIDTIRAILLLITYIETNFVFCQVNYILCSVAIRFAQEMGLHLWESYQSLPTEEQFRRRTAWWFCHFYDVEICFRSGKPPLINVSDVTTNTDVDPNAFMALISPFDSNLSSSCNLVGQDNSDLMREESGNTYKLGLLLTNIRAKSYVQLFAASVKLEPLEDICRTLDLLDNEMFALAGCVEPELRPRFMNDPEFRIIDGAGTTKWEGAIAIQFIYFLHMMLINRIPSVVKSSAVDKVSNVNKFRQLSLDSARTILVIAAQFNKENCFASFYNWILFYPASAFLSLAASVLNHPHLPEALSDLRLLISTSFNFFSMRVSSNKSDKIPYIHNTSMISLIMKLMLNVVVRFYESKVNSTVFKTDKVLQDHLNSPRIEYPDLFRSTSDFQLKMLKFVLGASVFENISMKNAFDQGTRRVLDTTLNAADAYDRAFSPSLNPSVANILHPDNIVNSNENSSYENNTMNNKEFISTDSPSYFGRNNVIEDLFDDEVLSQFNNLPNFFFDNHFQV